MLSKTKPKYGFGSLLCPASPHESVLFPADFSQPSPDLCVRQRLGGDTLMAGKILHILPACFLKSEQVKDVAAAPNNS